MEEGYRLYYADHHEALTQAIEQNVHGWEFKAVACRVYPTLSAPSAYARLKAVTNPEKGEKADLQEVLQICHVTGRYEPLFWLCDQTDHARPPKRAPQDRKAELLDRFHQDVNNLMGLAEEIKRSDVPASLKVSR